MQMLPLCSVITVNELPCAVGFICQKMLSKYIKLIFQKAIKK